MWQIQPEHTHTQANTHTFMRAKVRPFLQPGLVLPAHRLRTSWCDQQLSLSRVASWWLPGVVLPQCCPSGSASITIPLYVHISTLSWVTVMFLTDGGLPVNGSMLVGGVSQLASSPRPLCASPSTFSSHSLWILSFFFPTVLWASSPSERKGRAVYFIWPGAQIRSVPERILI